MKQTAKYLFLIGIFCLSASFAFAQPDISQTIAQVKQLVAQGDEALKAKNYDEAKRLFTEAIAAEDKAGLGAVRRNPRAYVGLTAALKGKGDSSGSNQVITNWFKTEASNIEAYLSMIDEMPFLPQDPNPVRRVDYITEAILLDSENPAYFVWRARLLRKFAPAAVADYNTALILYPKYPLALRERGEIFLASGEYDKAFADFEAYGQAGGDEQVYRLRRGMAILLKAGATAEAMQDLTKATTGADAKLRGEAFYYRGWGNFLSNNRPAAQADMTEAAKVNEKRKDDFYYRLAFEALPAGKCKSENDIRDARDDAYSDKKARASRRELSFLLFRISSAAIACYPATGKFNYQRVSSAQTIDQYSGNPLLDVSDMRRHQALDGANDKLSPDFKSVMLSAIRLAGFTLSEPDIKEEHDLYYRTIRNGFVRGDTAGNLKRAITDMEAGEYHRALALLNGILRVEPDNLAALETRMRVFYLKRAIIRADAEAAQILKASPNNAAALNIRGLHDTEANNQEGALNYFNRAIAADPNNPKPMINRGRIYLIKKQYPEALAEFERGIKLAPKTAYYIAMRGEAYYFMEKWAEAAGSYTEAVLLDEKDIFTRIRLVRSLDNAGNKNLADTHHVWLIKNAPDDPGTKALASRNAQLASNVSKAVQGQDYQNKIVTLFEKINDGFGVIEYLTNLKPTTDKEQGLERLYKVSRAYSDIIENCKSIENNYAQIRNNNLSVSPENMQAIQKMVSQVKKFKELAEEERPKVLSAINRLNGY